MTAVATSSGNAAKTTPNKIDIPPNGQGVFLMDYDPRTVNIQNNSDYDGQIAYVWIYPSATAVTPTVQNLQSQSNVTVRPPPVDGNGNAAKTIVIFNLGGAQITASERTT